MKLTVEEMVDLIKAGKKGAKTNKTLDTHAVYRALGKLHLELHKRGYLWDKQKETGITSLVERDHDGNEDYLKHSNECYLEDKEVFDNMESTFDLNRGK